MSGITDGILSDVVISTTVTSTVPPLMLHENVTLVAWWRHGTKQVLDLTDLPRNTELDDFLTLPVFTIQDILLCFVLVLQLSTCVSDSDSPRLSYHIPNDECSNSKGAATPDATSGEVAMTEKVTMSRAVSVNVTSVQIWSIILMCGRQQEMVQTRHCPSYHESCS